jgi:type III secretion system needle length determinant
VDATEIKDTSAMSGAKILNNIQLQHIEPNVSESVEAIKNLAMQVAEKIIATNEALNAKQEVRITLQDGILKDTEVSISKEGKSLDVVFSTGSNASENLLRANSETLMRQLRNNLKDIDRVDIEIEQHEQSANDNQKNDGRSRNRFGNQQQEEDEENQDK